MIMDFSDELEKRNASYRREGSDHIVNGVYEGITAAGKGKTSLDALNSYDTEIVGKRRDVRDVRAILAGRGDVVCCKQRGN